MMEITLTGIVIIAGNYGSGKTEISINLAAHRKRAGVESQASLLIFGTVAADAPRFQQRPDMDGKAHGNLLAGKDPIGFAEPIERDFNRFVVLELEQDDVGLELDKLRLDTKPPGHVDPLARPCRRTHQE